jgi:hypothetical protein
MAGLPGVTRTGAPPGTTASVDVTDTSGGDAAIDGGTERSRADADDDGLTWSTFGPCDEHPAPHIRTTTMAAERHIPGW